MLHYRNNHSHVLLQKLQRALVGWMWEPEAKSRYYKERNVQSKKRKAIRRWFVSIRHGRHVLSQCLKQRYFPPVLVPFLNISGGWLPLFRALAKNMAPMTNADESPTNRLTLFPIYLSLFIVSTLPEVCRANLLSQKLWIRLGQEKNTNCGPSSQLM